jgi:hypothetical protein
MVACPDSIASLATASEDVVTRIVALNQRNVVALSDLDRTRLAQLVDMSFLATVVGPGEAFLLSFDQSADYDSPNFRWFRQRLGRFVYVDRIVVSEEARGRGLATKLYRHLFNAAALAGHAFVGCEVNVDPPNPASDAFHDSFGFDEVGRVRHAAGKVVRYLVKNLSV